MAKTKGRKTKAGSRRSAKSTAKRKANVMIYTTGTCPYCSMAKHYLAEKGVSYSEVDVGTDPAKTQEMIMKSGQMGVPVFEINGKIIVGFDRGAIDAALSAR